MTAGVVVVVVVAVKLPVVLAGTGDAYTVLTYTACVVSTTVDVLVDVIVVVEGTITIAVVVGGVVA